jgi:integrase
MTTHKRGSPQKVREAFSNLFKEFFGEQVPSITVRKFVDRWLKDRKQETAPGTMSVYENSVRRFLSFLGPDADRELADVTRTRITDYRNEMVDNLSTGTVNRELKIVKMIFRKARLDGFLFEDPAEAVSIIKRHNEENSRRPLTIPEIRSILAVADAEWQSIIKFGLYTGQRLADLALLTWNHVDLKRGEIQVVTRKTGKRLLLPIAGALRDHIESLPATEIPGAPVHPRAFGSFKSHKGRTTQLSNHFIELMIHAGLRQPRSRKNTGKGRGCRRHGMDISFHSLRHSAVSILKDAGVPDSVVMELVGHDSRAMSARYTSVGIESLAKAQGAMPKL